MLSVIQKLFARLLIIVLGVVSIFTGGNADNISLELKEPVTPQTQVIRVEVINYTGKKVITDEAFIIEKNEDGAWTELAFAEDYSVKEIAIEISNLQAITFKIDLIKAFGKTLDEGEYRLTKTVGSNVSVTFTVSD